MGKLITEENAAEMQKRSAEARKANKAVREVLAEALKSKVGDLTKLEWLTQQALNNVKTDVTLKDIELIQKILGESVTTITHDIAQRSPEEARKLLFGDDKQNLQ